MNPFNKETRSIYCGWEGEKDQVASTGKAIGRENIWMTEGSSGLQVKHIWKWDPNHLLSEG